MCSATARARTQVGTLVCVAVLKVDITDIQAAPPNHQRQVDGDRHCVETATSISRAKARSPPQQALQPHAGSHTADHQPGAHRTTAQAGHQQADPGSAQRELALADHRQQRPQRRAAPL